MAGNIPSDQATSDSWFLRRLNFPNMVQHSLNGPVVHWRAFKRKQGETTSSYTLQNLDLQTLEGRERYRKKKITSENILPGICRISFQQFTQELRPPLPPRYDPDDKDLDYGHLHYCTDLPSKEQQETLALFATKEVLEFPEKLDPPGA